MTGTLLQSKEQRIAEQVSQAAQAIARYWPLRTFVYRNTLQGFEHLPFTEAAGQGKRLLGGSAYLPNQEYRRLYQMGKITPSSIMAAIRGHLGEEKAAHFFAVGSRRFEAPEILFPHLLYGIEGIEHDTFKWKVANEGVLDAHRSDVPQALRRQKEPVSLLWKAVLFALELQDPLGDEHNGSHVETSIDETGPSFQAIRRRRGFLWDHARVGHDLTLGEWVQELTAQPIVDPINSLMIKWCSAFLDEGMGTWAMPEREKGFYGAWREMAPYDGSGWFLGIRGLSGEIAQLPTSAQDTLSRSLDRLGIKEAIRADYLQRHLAQLPGWAGFIKWRGGEALYRWQQHYPMDLIQYLAVRLFYEAECVETLCRKTWQIGGNLSEMETYFSKHPDAYPLTHTLPASPRVDEPSQQLSDAWRLFHLAQFLAWEPEVLHQASKTELHQILRGLGEFPSEGHGPVWLNALERSYQQHLLHLLSPRSPMSAPDHNRRYQAQIVFCIDARSEGLRRHLEDLGEYETFGFAGFFGVPICFRAYGSEEELLLCPALLSPTQRIQETPRTGQKTQTRRRDAGAAWHHLNHGLFHDLKANNLTAYPLIDLLGGLVGLGFIGKMFFPKAYNRLREKLHHWLTPELSTSLAIDRPKLDKSHVDQSQVEQSSEVRNDPALSQYGFTDLEQAAFVANGLRMMGLTPSSSRIVFLCAHGSSSANNPYAAAYDCGACGGNHGGPNARVLAAMANKPSVRELLREQGIHIPDDTVFIPGEHNTTTDQIFLLDRESVPESHRDEADRLLDDLNRAGIRLAQDRLGRLPAAPQNLSSRNASSHVELRSLDWAQVRPEWGLSGNAAFVIGRRAITHRIDLEGRVFLHSYDPEQDPEGKALESIMTAPLLVVQWISMEYYFSCTDPWVYGSGSKVLHNVVSGVGVMLGRQGDLRPGLPLQSVKQGDGPYHEPMRPLVIIDSPVERIGAIIQRHQILQSLFHGQWVHLLARQPDSRCFWKYRPDGGWQAVEPAGAG